MKKPLRKTYCDFLAGMSLLLPESVTDGDRDEIDQISEAIDETLDRIRCKLDNMLFAVRKTDEHICTVQSKI